MSEVRNGVTNEVFSRSESCTEQMIQKLKKGIEEHQNSFVPVCLTDVATVYRDILPMLEKLKRYEDLEAQEQRKMSFTGKEE